MFHGQREYRRTLLNLPPEIRTLIILPYILVVKQNSEASFKVIAFSASSAALDLDVCVYIDANKAENTPGGCQSTR